MYQVSMFKNGLNKDRFHEEIMDNFHDDTQEGFRLLANAINTRIKPCLRIEFDIRDKENLMILLSHSGLVQRLFAVSIKHNDMYTDLIQVENILTAFACGVGYDD